MSKTIIRKATLLEILWFGIVTLVSLIYLLFAGNMGYWPFGGEGLQWVNVLIGMVIVSIYYVLIIPDPWSEWLSKWENSPITLLGVAVLFILIFSSNFIPVFERAVSQVLHRANIQPWVFVFLGIGVFVLILLLAVEVVKKIKSYKNKE